MQKLCLDTTSCMHGIRTCHTVL